MVIAMSKNTKARSKSKPETTAEACCIESAVPNKIKIGGVAKEVVIGGTGLATAGLRLKIYAVSGTVDDPAILVEQPLPDGVTDEAFPVTVTVLAEATKGSRKVALILDGAVACEKPDLIEVIY